MGDDELMELLARNLAFLDGVETRVTTELPPFGVRRPNRTG